MNDFSKLKNCLVCENQLNGGTIKNCFLCRNTFSHIEYVSYVDFFSCKNFQISILTTFYQTTFENNQMIFETIGGKDGRGFDRTYCYLNISFFNSFLPYLKNNREATFFNIVSLLQ